MRFLSWFISFSSAIAKEVETKITPKENKMLLAEKKANKHPVISIEVTSPQATKQTWKPPPCYIDKHLGEPQGHRKLSLDLPIYHPSNASPFTLVTFPRASQPILRGMVYSHDF